MPSMDCTPVAPSDIPSAIKASLGVYRPREGLSSAVRPIRCRPSGAPWFSKRVLPRMANHACRLLRARPRRVARMARTGFSQYRPRPVNGNVRKREGARRQPRKSVPRLLAGRPHDRVTRIHAEAISVADPLGVGDNARLKRRLSLGRFAESWRYPRGYARGPTGLTPVLLQEPATTWPSWEARESLLPGGCAATGMSVAESDEEESGAPKEQEESKHNRTALRQTGARPITTK